MQSANDDSAYRVSVVIPAYNCGKYIARALESVLAQTRAADEIIVVDDGSTDDTAATVQRFGGQVRYIHQANAGASAARNAGINAARYPWVAFLDGDDEWLPEKLQLQIALLQRNKDLVWAGGNFTYCYCHEDRRRIGYDPRQTDDFLDGKEPFDSFFVAFGKYSHGCTDCMLIKRQILLQADLFAVGQPTGEDVDVWWRIAYRWPRFGYISRPLAIYHRQVTQSVSQTCDKPSTMVDLVERHLKLATQSGCLEEFKPCAERLLRPRIRRALFDETIVYIRDMIRFRQLFSSRYKVMMRLLTIWPHATLKCIRLLSRINRTLHIRK